MKDKIRFRKIDKDQERIWAIFLYIRSETKISGADGTYIHLR